MKHPILAAAALSTLLTSSAFAVVDVTWISTSSAAFTAAGNWSPFASAPPGIGVGAYFIATNPAIVLNPDISFNSITLQGISFGMVAGGSGFTIRSSSPVVAAMTIRAGGASSDGIENLDDNSQTFNVPISMSGAAGTGTPAANSNRWDAAGGDIVLSGLYGGTVSTVNNNGGTLYITGAHNVTIGSVGGKGDIIGGGSLNKSGAGLLTLGGTNANTFSGGLTLNQGIVLANKIGAFGSGKLTLNGGTLQLGSYNQSVGNVLSLQGNATLDFAGNGSLLPGTNTMSFNDSHSQSWAAGAKLTVLDVTINSGDPTSVFTTGLRFGTTSTGLNAGQLGALDLVGYDNFSYSLDPNGFVVATVPEPSSLALSLLGGFGMAMLISRRRKA